MSNLAFNVKGSINVVKETMAMSPEEIEADRIARTKTHDKRLDWSDSVTDVLHDPDNEGGFIITHSSDISGAIEGAKKARELAEMNHKRSDEMRPLMQIPGALIEQYCVNNGLSWAEFWSPSENQKHIKAILTDPDLSYFRLMSYNTNCFK